MATAISTKDEFRNTTSGWLGVVQIDGRGDQHGVPVAPGDSVWLSEEEQIATANAPRADEDNPFLPREHPTFDDDGNQVGTIVRPALELMAKGAEVRNRRPFGAIEQPITPAEPEPEETGAVPEPDGDPELGSNAPAEEVATPNARGRRRRGT